MVGFELLVCLMSRDGLLMLALYSGVTNLWPEKPDKFRLIPLESYRGNNERKNNQVCLKTQTYTVFGK